MNISSLSKSIRAGRLLMSTPSILVCLDVKGQDLSPAVTEVEGLKYDCMLDHLASHIFVSHIYLQTLKTSYKPTLNLHAFQNEKTYFPAIIAALSFIVQISHKHFTFCSWMTSLQGCLLLPSVWIDILSFCNCISFSLVSSWSWDAALQHHLH